MPAITTVAAADCAREPGEEDAPGPSEDSLVALRARVAEARDLQLEIEDVESRLTDLRARLGAITRKDLPEAFQEIGIQLIGLDARGNLPPYLAKLTPYYRACISSEWPPEKQAAGFAALEGEPGGDELIKCAITVLTGRGELEVARRVKVALDALGVEYAESMSVHHMSLTAWLRNLVEKKKRFPPVDVLEAIGGTVGNVVKIEPIKERR